MKRMLINATQPEELRVAIADGQQLFDLDIEVPSQEQKKSNVYKGKITRVEPSLEACFVEFGSSRHGFLPLKEICESLWSKNAVKKGGKVAIRDAVQEGQEIIVQVEKEERGNKGAALTTFISLAGRYLVLMPTNPSAGGVSRRITGNDRDHLREQLQKVTTPDNVGIIIRTAGVGREAEELQWDLDYLLQLWSAIEQAAAARTAPFLIHQESNLFIRALRDHLRNDIGEILIDSESVYNDAREFMQQVMPHNLNKLKLYKDQVPLFNRYQIESQIESAFARTVHLPAGGAIVFDHTEALLSIDINSARATKGTDIEDTAYSTNMEAAKEIARQLRLRDLGGLIVIDFIDMTSRKHQRDVEERLRDAMQIDKARVQIGRISRFGLLEMSRQRMRPSLGESSQETCPRCEGHGSIRSVESLALSIMRLVEEEVMKDFTGQLIVQAPVEVINFMHNEKRAALAEVESRHKVPIVMLANQHLVTPHFEILRVKKSDVTEEASYTRVEQPETKMIATERSQAYAITTPVPAVKHIVPERPAPVRSEEKAPGFFARLAGILFSHPKSQEKSRPEQSRSTTARPGQQTTGRPGKPAASQPAEQQSNQRDGQKQSAGKPQTGGQPRSQQQQRTGKKRTSKKAQSRKNQQTGGQGQSDQQPTAQTQSSQQPPGKRGTKRVSNRQKPAAPTPSENTQAADNKNLPQASDQPAAGNAEADGNVKPEQKEGSSRRGGRRRRSPYKTGGSKPRTERDESQAGAAPGGDSGQPADGGYKPRAESSADTPADKTPASAAKPQAVEARSESKESLPNAPAKPELKPVEAGPSESVHTEAKSTAVNGSESNRHESNRQVSNHQESNDQESKPVESRSSEPAKTDAKPADSKPADKAESGAAINGNAAGTANAETTADGGASSRGKAPVKAKKRPARKKAASKKTSGKKVRKKSAETDKAATTPIAAPPMGAEKDAKGIYTLKPPPSE